MPLENEIADIEGPPREARLRSRLITEWQMVQFVAASSCLLRAQIEFSDGIPVYKRAASIA
jgi:hypothetical protein